MKRKSYQIISVVLTILMLYTTAGFRRAAAHAEEFPGRIDDFNDNSFSGWWGSSNYVLTAENGELKGKVDKANNSWASFGYNFDPLDISATPYISLKVKSDMDFTLNLSVFDSAGKYTYPEDDPANHSYEIIASRYYSTYTFNFSGRDGKVDLKQIKSLNLVLNPGTPGAEGTVYLDDVKIGSPAERTPQMIAVPEQQTYKNAPEQSVHLRGIQDGTENTHPVSIAASSSNPDLIPSVTVDYSGGSTGFLKYTPSPGKSGISTITVSLTAAGTNAAKTVMFDILVEDEMVPKIDPIENQTVKSGIPQQIRLTGIDDGNPNARQGLTVAAVSSNQRLIPNPHIEYTSDNRWGLLSYTPAAGKSGTSTITVTVSDQADKTAKAKKKSICKMRFQVQVWKEINHAPEMDVPKDITVLENEGECSVNLTGIGDGEEETEQELNLTAESSNPDLINPTVEYLPGSSNAVLRFTPAADRVGDAVITLHLSDHGGNSHNNGDMAADVSFQVHVRARPVTGFADDFEDGILDPSWTNSGEGCHFVSEIQDGNLGVLKIDIDKTKTNNPWAGLWYGIPEELDLSENPYLSIRMKTDTPPTDMLIFLWDAYGHYNTAKTVRYTVTGEYTEYYFDFSDKLTQGDGTPVDPSRITALLFNFAPGAIYTGSFFFDDLKVGDQADRPFHLPDITLNGIPDFAIGRNAGIQSFPLTGINSGLEDPDAVTLTAESDNKDLIPEINLGKVESGTADLEFTPAQDKTGSAVLTVTASAEGANSKSIHFRVDVLDQEDADSSAVTIDPGIQYQEIDGFGAFLGSGQLSSATMDMYLRGAEDLGISMARFGIIDTSIEPVNDNSSPYITDYSALNYSALPLDFMKTLKEKTAIDKYILTFWSPSSWMKKNKWSSAESWASNNRLDPEYYEEYVEQLIATLEAVKEKTGIDLYAISLQNEPEFNEPYASCVLKWNEYRDLIKTAGPRFREEGIKTKIFMPEALWAQGNIDEYVNTLTSDPEAAEYVDIVAVHDYDEDGIHVGGTGASNWKKTYELAQKLPNGKKTWMTETSGYPNSWDGAITLAANIYTALYYGNTSGWVWWSLNASPSSAAYGLLVNGEPTSRYEVSRQFYQFIKPDDRRIKAESIDPDILSLAFEDPAEQNLSVILINRSSASKSVKIQSDASLPDLSERFTTSDNRMFERGNPGTNGTVLLPPSSITTLSSRFLNQGEAPSIPENLTASEITDTSVTLSWDASTDDTGVQEYEIYSGSRLIGKTSDTSDTVTGLSPASEYDFTVAARDQDGNTSAVSGAVSVTTLPKDTASPVITLKITSRETDNAVFQISGSLNEPGTVKVNGIPTDLSDQYSFHTSIILKSGWNLIHIEARDVSGNRADAAIRVKLANQKKPGKPENPGKAAATDQRAEPQK